MRIVYVYERNCNIRNLNCLRRRNVRMKEATDVRKCVHKLRLIDIGI